ncbi:MAG: arylsulfatase [Opitutales bacterium]
MKKITIGLMALFGFTAMISAETNKLNVLFVMTDDQGQGDLSCNGNPYLKTPHIDKLSTESYNFTNYHTATTCAPTRSGLMSGVYCNKVGVWHTIQGRSLLDLKREIMPEIFQKNGYATAMFGKWHLGDEYPYRPFDRGFETVFWHKGGGIGQGPDYWDNTYFNPVLFDKETPVETEGFCTDIFFDRAIDFMKKAQAEGRPFFCYLSLNAAHGPFVAPKEYEDRFKDMKGVPNAAFYGMIENIDDNMGKMEAFLQKSGLAKNTIYIFTTDNGSSFPAVFDKDGNVTKGWSNGLKANKGAAYEGGHNVPFFMRIPNGKSVEINQLMGYIDVAPTLMDLCGIESDWKIDGLSMKPVIDNPKSSIDRYLLGDTQRDELLRKDARSVVMKGSMRLVDRKELYDLSTDRRQMKNIAASNPEVVSEMLKVQDEYWEYIVPENEVTHPLYLPTKPNDSVVLNGHDMHLVIPGWSQIVIRSGKKIDPRVFWYVKVPEDGEYTMELFRWAPESTLNMLDKYSGKVDNDAAIRNSPKGNTSAKTNATKGAMNIVGGELIIADINMTENLAAGENPKSIKFENIKLKKGEYNLNSNYILKDGSKGAAFYLKVTKNN